MPRIIFVRPAETDAFSPETVLGQSDPDLSTIGRHCAGVTAQALARYPIGFIAISPLRRALSTAMELQHLSDVFVHPFAAFQAADMGEWTGRDIASINIIDRARYETWLKDPDFPAPGGETTRKVYARAYNELVNIVNHAQKDETIALVLPISVMRPLICAVLDLPLESAHRFHLDHGAYGVFERIYPGGPYQMLSWNRNDHLVADSLSSLEEWESELPGV